VITSKKQQPPVGLMGGSVHSYERGLSPWHADAFPARFKRSAPERGKRRRGWFALDAYGNLIGFIQDGTEFANV
jgi:hypothetical protein